MQAPFGSRRHVRSGLFEVDLDSGEMHKSGRRVPLQDQPFRVLSLLLERPGEIITRDELQSKLWSSDSFVGFDEGINTAIRKLRIAFGDSADNPRFIETVPRRGYRFVAPVSTDGFKSSGAEVQIGVPQETIAAAASAALEEQSTERDKDRSGSPFGHRMILLTACAVGILVLLGAWKWYVQPQAQPRVVRFVQLTNDGQPKLGPLATDGARIYFTELLPGQIRSLSQVSTDGGDVVHIPTPLSRPRLLDLSPDEADLLLGNQEEIGRGSIQVDSGADSLWIQPLAGGSPRRVGSALVNDASWGADKGSIVYGNEDAVYLMNQDGESARKLLSQHGSSYSFSFSPNGRVLRFSLRDAIWSSSSIMESSAQGNNTHALFPGCCGRWTSDQRYFVFQSEQDGRSDLWALRERLGFQWGRADTGPIQLTAGPLEFEAPVPSKNGKTIFAIGNLRRAEVVRYDAHNREFTPYFFGISAEGLSFSKDGKWIAYTSYPDGTLWKSRIDGSERIQLTFPPMRVLLPRWSPDGRQIAFSATSTGHTWNVYLIPSEGGAPKQQLADAEARTSDDWSPDGKSLVISSFDIPNTPIWILDLKTATLSTVPGSVGLFSARWSPDGRYLCAITSERPFRLRSFDFTTQTWTQLFDLDMGYPSWTHDGRYIYFERELGHVESARIDRIRISDRKVETIVDLKNLGRSATGTITEWIGLDPNDAPLVTRDISTHEIYALEWERR